MDTIKLRAEVGGGLWKSLLYMGMAFVFLMLGVFLFVPLMKTVIAAKLKINMTFATHFLFGLNTFLTGVGLVVIPASAVALYLVRRQIWVRIRTLPGVRMFWMYAQLGRAIRFITAFRPLYEAGVSTLPAVEILARSASATDRDALRTMRAVIGRGGALSTALEDPEYWPASLRQGVRGFEKSTDEGRADLLSAALDMTVVHLKRVASTISMVLTLLGLLVAGVVVILIVLGFMIPMMSLTAA